MLLSDADDGCDGPGGHALAREIGDAPDAGRVGVGVAPHSTHGGKSREIGPMPERFRGDPAGDTPTHLPVVPTVDGPLCVKAPYADEVAVVVLRGSPRCVSSGMTCPSSASSRCRVARCPTRLSPGGRPRGCDRRRVGCAVVDGPPVADLDLHCASLSLCQPFTVPDRMVLIAPVDTGSSCDR